MTDEQRLIKVEREYYKKHKREYDMSTVKKNYFERIEGAEILRVSNRIQAKTGKN